MIIKEEHLQENDWILLSNIVQAYDNYCLKPYTQRRHLLSIDEIESFSKLKYHAATILDQISSFLSFLYSIPLVKSLSKADRVYLCKHNIRPLMFPHRHEIEQTCFSEPWEVSDTFLHFSSAPIASFFFSRKLKVSQQNTSVVHFSTSIIVTSKLKPVQFSSPIRSSHVFGY